MRRRKGGLPGIVRELGAGGSGQLLNQVNLKMAKWWKDRGGREGGGEIGRLKIIKVPKTTALQASSHPPSLVPHLAIQRRLP